eukprot:CAMPEP_0197078546 /NCGR_PEP_ID=MMETSP1384-20130603/213175_1 /TAXON_ID=29189 /ORGANISM="Ammonia sp." /LENGTH=642 /DNA_ID=CAMNT_0042517413 /DNA_START=18 /DNA_END=1943 /DNA_ORIENTATION=-
MRPDTANTRDHNNELLTEIEMNDREDSVDLSIQSSTSQLKPCYWGNLNKEQKAVYILLIIVFLLVLLLVVIIMNLQHNVHTNTSSSTSQAHICYYDTSSFTSPASTATTATPEDSDRLSEIEIADTPKNLIVMIGDGMGTAFNTAYRLHHNQQRTILDNLYKGRYSTNPLNNSITDSAAGATAFSTGRKTFNGNIATDIGGNPLGTLLEALKRKGKGTGLIATKSVTDATPASFAAHALNRNFQHMIAKQLAALHLQYEWTNCSVIDILMGGGKMFFDSWGFDSASYAQYGWNSYLTDNDTLYTLCKEDMPIIGLFADNEMPFYLDLLHTQNNRVPSLLDMSRVSLKLLNESYYEQGFFAMIEGSKIDVCAHVNDVACIMNEMTQFYDTVEYVTQWAQQDGDTLVVILADHETGGLSIGRQDSVMQAEVSKGYTLHGMPQQELLEFYGDYRVNPLITTRETDATQSASYVWHSEIIDDIEHTTMWFNQDIGNATNITQIYQVIEQHWFELTEKEKYFLNFTFAHNGKLYEALTHIINVRTNTAFTTHGHTAVDVSLYAYGVSSDAFVGHWSNHEIGQLLSKIMDCVDEQNEQTSLLQQMFVNDELSLCDATDKPHPIILEWNASIPYPWGSLLYGQNCVESW